MDGGIFSITKRSLRFLNNEIEEQYKKHIFEHTALFCRIAWGLVIFLGGAFMFLDRPFFGSQADVVIEIRSVLIGFAFIVLTATFIKPLRKYADLSSALLITAVGLFSIYLTAISDPTEFSPYFTGIFYAFTGIFSTAGMGFRYSFIALLINLIFFEIVFTLIVPISTGLFVIYNFFLPGFLILFAYIAYFTEKISRDNYFITEQLKNSFNEINTLSGLLPICSHCKKIRDDKGYWNQLEQFVHNHTEARFSHSLCPDCTKELLKTLPSKIIKDEIRPG